MGKFSLSRERTILLSFVAAFFSIFTMTTISTIPMDNANAVTYISCSAIDASSRGECDYDRDISEEGFRDCINGVNCIATKDFRWENTNLNTFNSQSEEAKINIDLLQLLNCGDDDCFISPGNPDALNVANHKVDVRSLANSWVDFDVDFEMTQQSDGDDQDNYIQDNFGDQQFLVTARNNAIVDADGDGNDVEFKMNQFNDECDDSECTNSALQYNAIEAEGSSRVYLDSDTGFTVTQTNNGCDVDDGETPGTVSCTNESVQGLDIFTLNNPLSTTPTNRATVIYDTLGPSTTTQSNNCVFDVIECLNQASSNVLISAGDRSLVDFDDAEQNIAQSTDCNDSTGAVGISCTNTADLDISVGATGNSRVDVDFAEQDLTQSADCDNANGGDCLNEAKINLAILAGDEPSTTADGIVNAEGSQIARQTIDCEGSDCENVVDMFVGLGIDNNGDNAVTGTLNADYDQTATQLADCNNAASCVNDLTMWYFATAKDASTVTSTSDQTATQSSVCTNKICNNVGVMVNNVFAEDTARLTGTSTQTLTQTCNNSVAGPCTNNNMQTTSGSAINNAIFTYTTGQTLNNGPSATGDGDQSITLSRTSGTSSASVFQNQPGQTFP